MDAFIASHAHAVGWIILVLTVGSLLFPTLNASLPEKWKKANPDAARLIDALSDLFLNGLKFASKALGSRTPPAPQPPVDQTVIIIPEDPK